MNKKYKQYYKIIGHSNLLNYKINESKKIIESFLKQVKNPYIAFSGGKDSIVMLHLISQIDKNIDVFTEANNLDWDFKESYCKQFIKSLGFKNYYYIKNKIDCIEYCKQRFFQKDKCKRIDFIKEAFKKIKNNNYDGYFVGLRKDESRIRKINYYKKGIIYKKDNFYTCTPIINFKGEEIFGYIVKYNLDYMEIYDKDIFQKPHEIRSHWAYNPFLEKFDIPQYQEKWIKYYYPKLFKKLEKEFPKIREKL